MILTALAMYLNTVHGGSFDYFLTIMGDLALGSLTLIMYAKSKGGFPSNKSVWSKSCCAKCFIKLCSTQSQGDKIREELDEHIDKRRIEYGKKIKLLG